MEKYKPHGLAKLLIDEVIKADMTMHEQQIEGWTWMNRHRPRGEHIPRDIMRGLSRSRYLSINEVEFKFHVKPVPVKTFWQRCKLAYKLLFDRNYFSALQPFAFDFCNSKEKEAQFMALKVRRLENGKIKASYEADDQQTAEIMN